MMAAVPGHVGLPIVGDKSIEFYRDVLQFTEKRIEQHKCRIFSARFLNKPTIFVASHNGVHSLLNEHYDKLDLGYKAFMYQIYGDNILFSNGSEAEDIRSILKCLLTSQDSVEKFRHIIERQTEKHLGQIQCGVGVDVYELFKRLATEICLCMFLDIDFESSEELAEKIVSLTTSHWHGIISVPVNINIGLSKSTFSKAMDAKNQLLLIIEAKLSESADSFPQQLKDKGFSEKTSAVNHLLLLTSALVPKALASLLSSFTLATAGNISLQTAMIFDDKLLNHTLREVQRLWPPLVGGRRVTTQSFELCGYNIPANHAIVYLSHHAQRDPDTYKDPDSFMPDRWSDKEIVDPDGLFTLGGGPRDCIGRYLVWDILNKVCKTLTQRFTWARQNPGEVDVDYKWLPVTRPRHSVFVEFQSKEKQII